MPDSKIKVGEIIGAFISTIFGLALYSTVASYGKVIETDNNSSDLVKVFAPYIALFWVLGCLGLAGMLMYKYFTT